MIPKSDGRVCLWPQANSPITFWNLSGLGASPGNSSITAIAACEEEAAIGAIIGRNGDIYHRLLTCGYGSTGGTHTGSG